MKITKTPYFSYKIGELPIGCKFCVKGEKLVLFITGICNRNCFYCPLSEQKKNKDVIFANEWETSEKDFKTIIKEAKLCNSKGAGITGGDPLLVINRTVNAIKKLKKTFGKRFHIHIYTSLNNVNYDKLKKLKNAGLDEIRVHPDLNDDRYWTRIGLLNKFNWDVGVEIPAVPGYEKQTKKLLDYVNDKVQFVNLNELEMSDTNVTNLSKFGFKPKNSISYGAKGSEESALKLMKYILNKKYEFNVHYCTCRLKDAVQLKQRIKRRAKNVALKFDKLTKEGTLIRGVIYLPELYPSFSYRKKLKKLTKIEKIKLVKKLDNAKILLGKLGIASAIDEVKMRLLANPVLLNNKKNILKKNKLIPAKVEEYPTHDATEVEINPL